MSFLEDLSREHFATLNPWRVSSHCGDQCTRSSGHTTPRSADAAQHWRSTFCPLSNLMGPKQHLLLKYEVVRGILADPTPSSACCVSNSHLIKVAPFIRTLVYNESTVVGDICKSVAVRQTASVWDLHSVERLAYTFITIKVSSKMTNEPLCLAVVSRIAVARSRT